MSAPPRVDSSRIPGDTDVLVIGGGITGCGVAREAAFRGLAVVLVEKRDLAAGTSGASTKLLHGGLRYLEYGQIGLVRQALREREAIAAMAPHLARPLTIVFPTRRGERPGRFRVRAGVALYQLMSGSGAAGRGHLLSVEDVRRLVPRLADAGLTGGVSFVDRATEDARLTLEVARDAARMGARIHVGVEAVELLAEHGRIAGARLEDRETGARRELRARVVVNAAGVWADRVRAMAGSPDRVLRPSRGTHLVLRDIGLGCAVMLPGNRPGQRFFAIPWRGQTLLGTTDEEDPGEIDSLAPSTEDVAFLLEVAARHFPSRAPFGHRILSAFSGLRPLLRSPGDTLSASREHAVFEDRGMMSLVGGKLTTWRAMAEDLVLRLPGVRAPGGRRASAARTLPGGDTSIDATDRRLASLDDDTKARVVEIYGADGVAIAGIASSDPSARERVREGGADVLAQVDFAVREEFARTVEDVVLRRLLIGHDPEACLAAAPRVASRMARILGWSAERESVQLRALQATLERRDLWRTDPGWQEVGHVGARSG